MKLGTGTSKLMLHPRNDGSKTKKESTNDSMQNNSPDAAQVNSNPLRLHLSQNKPKTTKA